MPKRTTLHTVEVGSVWTSNDVRDSDRTPPRPLKVTGILPENGIAIVTNLEGKNQRRVRLSSFHDGKKGYTRRPDLEG